MIKVKNLLVMVSIFTNFAVLRVKLKLTKVILNLMIDDFQFTLVEMYVMHAFTIVCRGVNPPPIPPLLVTHPLLEFF